MGQKTRPTGFRIGIVEEWRSRWYASKKEFGDLLAEDNKIRTFIKKKYLFAGIPKIIIERTRDQVIVHLDCARPGIIIGR
jgi:small subunit ribosomal protein S3